MATQSEKYGKSVLRWQPHKDGGFAGVVVRDGKTTKPIYDDDQKRLLARLRNEAGRLHPDYVGFDGALKRFDQFFPEGLSSASNERGYKETAARRLREAMPLDEADRATDSDAIRVARASIATNMLSPFEAARLRDTLLGSSGPEYIRGAAAFAAGEYEVGAMEMAAAIEPHGRVSWPLVTYLPFLWDYERHMFLKPQVTCDFADRVGHEFGHVYAPEPTAETYLSLLHLVEGTKSAIRSLDPRDNIDIQSFIWVVGEYGEGDGQA